VAKKIRWTAAAADDLQSISEFISRDSERYAAITIDNIIGALERAGEFPGMGRQVPEFRKSTIREVIVYSYRAIYRVEEEDIVVLGIIHGARRLKKAMKGRA
jgi:toxin ParE1/3/4